MISCFKLTDVNEYLLKVGDFILFKDEVEKVVSVKRPINILGSKYCTVKVINGCLKTKPDGGYLAGRIFINILLIRGENILTRFLDLR